MCHQPERRRLSGTVAIVMCGVVCSACIECILTGLSFPQFSTASPTTVDEFDLIEQHFLLDAPSIINEPVLVPAAGGQSSIHLEKVS